MLQVPVYEMVWDCKFCGAQKVIGAHAIGIVRIVGRSRMEKRATFRRTPSASRCRTTDMSGRTSCVGIVELRPAIARGVAAIAARRWEKGRASRSARTRCTRRTRPMPDKLVAELARERSGVAAPAAPTPKKTLSAGLDRAARARRVVLCGGLGFAFAFFGRNKCAFTRQRPTSGSAPIAIETLNPPVALDSAWCDACCLRGRPWTRRHREERVKKQVSGRRKTCSKRKVDNGDGTFHEKQECTPKFKDEPVYDDKCDYRVNPLAYRTGGHRSGQLRLRSVSWPASNVARPGVA